jgi:nucleoside-diphosphate-sugar epimerase
MNILVTGASGFIGAHLTDYLDEQGHFVKGLSRKLSDVLIKMPSYDDRVGWRNLLQGTDLIVHCAGRAHIVNDTTLDPLKEFRQVNANDTLSLAKHALDAGVGRFVFFSSLGVFGSQTTSVPINESSTYNPTYDYAISKVEAEIALKDFFDGTDVELVIIRPPLVYAEHAPGNFERLIKLANSDIPLPFSGVKNRRSLISLDNLVEFTELCCTHKSAANEDFVVCDNDILTTSEIIENLRIGMNKKGMTFYLPESFLKFLFSIIGKGTLYNKVFGSLEVSNNKAKELLNWTPKGNSFDSLKKTGEKYKYERR